MPISEHQLDTWAKQGTVAQSQATYATVRAALEAADAPYFTRNHTIFLQGSYGNDTNIYADSDVDVVIRLDGTFYKDVSRLPPGDRAAYDAHFDPATYSYSEFKRDVAAQLTRRFGSAVKPGSKAIFVEGIGSRRDADVLPAAQWRSYTRFKSWFDQHTSRELFSGPRTGCRSSTTLNSTQRTAQPSTRRQKAGSSHACASLRTCEMR
jgi:hypothetical protein